MAHWLALDACCPTCHRPVQEMTTPAAKLAMRHLPLEMPIASRICGRNGCTTAIELRVSAFMGARPARVRTPQPGIPRFRLRRAG